MQGTIQTLVQERGFGIIAADGQEFFFHRGAVDGDFGNYAEGSRVVFEIDTDPKGDEPNERPRAVNVRLADDEVPAVDNVPLPPEKVGRA
jgi:cold shock CspA family protein